MAEAPKAQEILRSHLARIKTVSPHCPTCWDAYVVAENDLKQARKSFREQKKQAQSPSDVCLQELHKSMKSANSAAALDGIPGQEEKQAKLRETSRKQQEKAKQLYQALESKEKKQIPPEERDHLESLERNGSIDTKSILHPISSEQEPKQSEEKEVELLQKKLRVYSKTNKFVKDSMRELISKLQDEKVASQIDVSAELHQILSRVETVPQT